MGSLELREAVSDHFWRVNPTKLRIEQSLELADSSGAVAMPPNRGRAAI